MAQKEEDDNKETLDELLTRIENYLTNIASYTSEDAKILRIACETNGFDIDIVKDDFIEQDVNSNTILDDNDIKAKFTSDEAREKLYNDIKNAILSREPVYNIDSILNMDVTKIEKDKINEIKALYKRQASSLVHTSDDKNYYQILALGRENDMPLMQNLADTYARMKINNHISSQAEFKEKYALLNKIRNKKTKQTFEIAPASFHARGLPEARLKPIIKIDDDLETFYEWGRSSIQFITNVIRSKDNEIASLTPFQVINKLYLVYIHPCT